MISKTANEIMKEVEEDDDSSSSEVDDDNAKEEEEFNEPMPEIDIVALVSGDGYKFYLQKKVACMSELIKCAFDPNARFKESIKNEFRLPNIRGVVLERIVDYMHYKYMYKDDIKSAPKFNVKDDILIETYVAADYLIL